MFNLKVYVTFLVLFFAMDMLWLGVIARDFYKEQIGFLMRSQIYWIPAVLFYFLYIFSVIFFAFSPAWKEGSLLNAFCYAALFGLICYATYNLTNYATLEDWPLKLTIIDTLWGAFITGTVAAATFWLAKFF